MKTRLLQLTDDNAALLASLLAAGLLAATVLSRDYGSPLQTLLVVCIWSPATLYDLSRRWSADCNNCTLQRVRLFAAGFCIVFIGRQLFVNDALSLPAEILSLTHGRHIGGPLGEPDFDSLAIGCIGGLCCLNVDRALRNSLFTIREILKIGIQTFLAGTAISIAWMIASWTIISSGALPSNGYIISRAVFNISYSNPKYVIIVPAAGALYVCTVLFSVRGRASVKHELQLKGYR